MNFPTNETTLLAGTVYAKELPAMVTGGCATNDAVAEVSHGVTEAGAKPAKLNVVATSVALVLIATMTKVPEAKSR